MNQAPRGSTCAHHPTVEAHSTCPRCGGFVCQACERRTRPNAVPMCPACWELRAQRVAPQVRPPETRLASVGLVLGLASVLPLFPVWIGSLVVNVMVLRRRDAAFQRVRWMPVVGLVATLVGGVLWVGLAFNGR